MWNNWNNEYLTTGVKGGEKDFPRVMVRYEDLLYHPVEVVTKLCKCLEDETRKDSKKKKIHPHEEYTGTFPIQEKNKTKESTHGGNSKIVE